MEAASKEPEIMNLALDGIATQKCKIESYFGANRAIDGDISHRLNPGTKMAMTCRTKNPWLQIELKEAGPGDDNFINVLQSIRVKCRIDSAAVKNLFV